MSRTPLHDRVFRALLKLFPAEFRGDFGEAMTADFRDQRREVEGAPRHVRRLWLRTVVDVLRRAPREHLDVLSHDAAYAVRALRRHPVAAATAILSLAIGIGLNSAVYSVVSAVLWRSLPFTGSDRLVSVGTVTSSSAQPGLILAGTFLDLQSRTKTLDALAAGAMQGVTMVDPGEPAEISCLAVNPGFFDVFGMRPALGPGFSQADYDEALARRGTPNGPVPAPLVMMLSDTLWRQRFASDPNVVGKEVRLAGGDRVSIVAVMGPEIETLGRAMGGQCWFPDVPDAAQGAWRPRIVVGRLAPGRSIGEANAELEVIGRNLGEDPESFLEGRRRCGPWTCLTVSWVASGCS